ncbi:hypothetical protein [Porphyromonas gingivalis]|nr:hypothetical protein [Porphyromonas gingivalis]
MISLINIRAPKYRIHDIPYPISLRAKIFALVVAENMARKLFAFGVGSEKITHHNEKIPVPLLGKTQTAILAFWVRVFE